MTWSAIVGVDTVGNSLTKTASSGWNGGAASVESLSGDGFAEFTAAEATTHRMCGLTHAVTDSGYATIDFALYPTALGEVDIFEAGELINGHIGFGTYAPGDVFRVQIDNGVVSYLQNGVPLYTSTKTPVFPLMVDCSLYTTGATVSDVNLTATPFWQNVNGVTASGHSLAKTGLNGWNAGASSVSALTGDGWAEFTTAESTTHKMAGLTHAVADSGYATIDFAIQAIAGGEVVIYEAGTLINSGGFGTYAPGDVFRVQVTSGVVTYWQNGVQLYTSTKVPTFPLVLDTSLYSNGATIDNATLVPAPYFQNTSGVRVSNHNLSKVGAVGWNAGASTVASLNGDGYVEFTTAETTTHKMAGLTHAVTDSGYATIDYAFYAIAGGDIEILDRGIFVVLSRATYAAGDTFRVQVTNGVVDYLINGSLLYTSRTAPTFPLVFDSSLYSHGATVNNVALSASPYWQTIVGVRTSGPNIVKVGTDGWNAGASSIASLAGDGFAEFTTREKTTHKVAGLTHTAADSGYATIDFGIYTTAGGEIEIYEAGTLIAPGAFGTYTPGDVFRVAVFNGVVSYWHNGVHLYSSTKTPTFPLVFDASLYSNSATIEQARITPGLCGGTCSSNECIGGRCLITLASGQSNLSAIAVDATSVYWITAATLANDLSDGTVMKCSKDGCGTNPTTLAAGQKNPTEIALSPTGVYWTTNWWSIADPNQTETQVMKCSKDGCNLTPMTLFAAGPGSSFRTLVLDETSVYWPDNLGGTVMKCALGGCKMSPTILASGQTDPDSIAIDATNVYWTSVGNAGTAGNEGTVMKCALGGCGMVPTVLASGQSDPKSITVGPAQIGWTSGPHDIVMCPIDGCGPSPTHFASGLFPSGLALNANSLYWEFYPYEVVKCDVTGCGTDPTPVTGFTRDVVRFAVDDTSVYWTTVDGKVKKLTPK